ncbi:MAG: hypothetical protein ABSC17_05890 [Thermacetogeniaceae bacterium]
MLHWIAFIVIGLGIGWWFSREAAKPAMVLVLGLVGALVGGLVVFYGVKGHHTIITYGSIVVSIILALILALIGKGSK